MKSIDLIEKQIENSILEYLNFQRGVFAFKLNTTGIYDQRKNCFRKISRWVAVGCSDIILIVDGYVVFIEVKSKKGSLNVNQKVFCTKVMNSGAAYHVVRSLDEVKSILQILREKL